MDRTRLETHDQIDQFWNIFSQEILMTSDAEILEMLREEETTLEEVSQKGRAVIEAAIQESNRRMRTRIRWAYERSRDEILQTPLPFPRCSYKDKIVLVQSCIKKHQFLQPALMTAQHRKFDKLTKDDVDSLLRQLHFLGLLDSPVNP